MLESGVGVGESTTYVGSSSNLPHCTMPAPAPLLLPATLLGHALLLTAAPAPAPAAPMRNLSFAHSAGSTRPTTCFVPRV